MVRRVGGRQISGGRGLRGVEGPRDFRKQNFNNTCENRNFVGEIRDKPKAGPFAGLLRFAYPLLNCIFIEGRVC